ncbi:hypothetical protein H0H93_014579 [Arthromyces matolae]|nr:hypothetical protein H0H93_014579 [Arthromyces matolae]
MPKSNATSSSTPNHGHQASDGSMLMSDAIKKKKKTNAECHAAFRTRRAKYITALEETGMPKRSYFFPSFLTPHQATNLESVVIQLQESCREAHHENQELQQAKINLQHEFREREKFWRILLAKKSERGADCENVELPHLLPSFLSPPSSGDIGSAPMSQYPAGASNYRLDEDTSNCHSPYTYNPSSVVSYSGLESESLSDAPWSSQVSQNVSSSAESSAHSSRSPGFIGSTAVPSTDMSFVRRFPPEGQKVPLSTLNTAAYAFSDSHSIFPSSSTPNSASSSSLPSFRFSFPDKGGQDRPEHEDRRHKLHPHGPGEVTLNGGIANKLSVGPASDAVKYRLANQKDPISSERPLLPMLPPLSGSDHGSSNGDIAHSHSRTPRRTGISRSRSRSRSPPPAISGTLAAIRSHAFGAAHRPRRTIRTVDRALSAKIAMNVLESRGLRMAPPSVATSNLEIQRLDNESDLPRLTHVYP